MSEETTIGPASVDIPGIANVSVGPFKLSDLCKHIPNMPDRQLCLTLPGGAQLCPSPTQYSTGMFEYAQLALGAANSALAPLRPIFELIEVVTLIVKCLETIPDVVGPPPNPQPLIETLTLLARKMKVIVSLAPPLTAPLILLQVIDMLIVNLQGVADELYAIARHMDAIESARNRTYDIDEMKDILDCVSTSASAQMSNLQKMIASVNPVIELLNIFAKLAQLGDPFPLPALEFDLHKAPLALADDLRTVANTLLVARQAIPI